jgi:hypothetical protein
MLPVPKVRREKPDEAASGLLAKNRHLANYSKLSNLEPAAPML